MIRYEHTQQPMWLIRFVMPMLGLAAIIFGLMSREFLPAVIPGAVILITWGLFYSLTVIIDDTHLRVRFGPGLIRFKFSLAKITACRTVKNSWMYGWGIRMTPHGWLYNIGGLDAVEIDMENGRRCRIGTDDAQRFIAKLTESLPH